MDPDRILCNLPVDIARQVIETAVVMDRKSALAFVLVSKTLREWSVAFRCSLVTRFDILECRIDPLLYNTVVLDSYRKGQLFVSAMFRRNDPDFFGRNVKTLSINHDVHRAHIEYILPICRGVISLAFWNRNRILKPYASILSPRRLSITNLTRSQVAILPGSLTHLNIFFTEDLSLADFPPTWPEVFEQCPNLTHLSFDYAPDDYFSCTLFRWGLDLFIEPILFAAPPTLRAVIVEVVGLSRDFSGMLDFVENVHIEDPRFVFVCPRTFYKNVKGLLCYEKNHDPTVDWGYLPEDADDLWGVVDAHLKRPVAPLAVSQAD